MPGFYTYCSLRHQAFLSPPAQPQLRVLSALGQMLLSFWSCVGNCPPLSCGSLADNFHPGAGAGAGGSSSILLLIFHTDLGVFAARTLERVAVPSFGGLQCQNSSP